MSNEFSLSSWVGNLVFRIASLQIKEEEKKTEQNSPGGEDCVTQRLALNINLVKRLQNWQYFKKQKYP